MVQSLNHQISFLMINIIIKCYCNVKLVNVLYCLTKICVLFNLCVFWSWMATEQRTGGFWTKQLKSVMAFDIWSWPSRPKTGCIWNLTQIITCSVGHNSCNLAVGLKVCGLGVYLWEVGHRAQCRIFSWYSTPEAPEASGVEYQEKIHVSWGCGA